MKRSSLWFSLMSIAVLALAACAPAEAAVRGTMPYLKDGKISAENQEKLAAMEQAFAFQVLQTLDDKESNLVFSPYSLYQVLVMTEAGASGETANEMQAALGMQGAEGDVHAWMNAVNQALQPEGEDFQLKIANALWPQETAQFEKAFLETLSKYYDAGLHPVDYRDPEAARAAINAWIAQQTEGRIEELIAKDQIDAVTRLVLTNAIYFHAQWEKDITALDNSQIPFYGLNGAVSTPPMMRAREQFAYYLDDAVSVVRVPYGAQGKVMLVLMPKAGSLASFQAGLNAETLQAYLAKLQTGEAELLMPAFKFESSLSMAGVLKAMGMQRAFDTKLAQFERMSSTEGLYISAVVHKAEVEVDAKGTTASAGSAVVVAPKSAPLPSNEPQRILVDHPFLFTILDENTGQLLFLGRLSQP